MRSNDLWGLWGSSLDYEDKDLGQDFRKSSFLGNNLVEKFAKSFFLKSKRKLHKDLLSNVRRRPYF